MKVQLIWQATFNPPPGMEGWSLYRVEYHDAGREVAEGALWLPPGTTALIVTVIERVLIRAIEVAISEKTV